MQFQNCPTSYMNKMCFKQDDQPDKVDILEKNRENYDTERQIFTFA